MCATLSFLRNALQNITGQSLSMALKIIGSSCLFLCFASRSYADRGAVCPPVVRALPCFCFLLTLLQQRRIQLNLINTGLRCCFHRRPPSLFFKGRGLCRLKEAI